MRCAHFKLVCSHLYVDRGDLLESVGLLVEGDKVEWRLLRGFSAEDGAGTIPDEEGGGKGVSSHDGEV